MLENSQTPGRHHQKSYSPSRSESSATLAPLVPLVPRHTYFSTLIGHFGAHLTQGTSDKLEVTCYLNSNKQGCCGLPTVPWDRG